MLEKGFMIPTLTLAIVFWHVNKITMVGGNATGRF